MLGQGCLTRLHLGKLTPHHPSDDSKVGEVAIARDTVCAGHFAELVPKIAGIEGLASLVIHEGDDLVSHRIVLGRMITLLGHAAYLVWEVYL